MGLTTGFLFGPPVGGALNEKLGYRAPFILGMIACTIDLIGRLFIIEKHDAARWLPQETNGEVDTASGMHSYERFLAVFDQIWTQLKVDNDHSYLC